MKQQVHNYNEISQFHKNKLNYIEPEKNKQNNKYLGGKMDTINNSSVASSNNSTVATTPAERALQRIYSVGSFFLSLAKMVGLFLFGIFIGMGVVLRNPPEDKKNLEVISNLQSQISSLKQEVKKSDEPKTNLGTVKTSIVVKN